MSKISSKDVGEAIVDILEAVGIDTCFGIPGGQTLPFYKAARARGFGHVLVRDERNGACAADAYARVSGKVGVCDATVGPGVTNLVSGLAEAYASSVPVLALIADIETQKEHLRERSVTMQAMGQRAMLEPIVKWYGRVQTPDMLVDVFDHALRVATSGRPGPVVVEIPEDIMPLGVEALDLTRFNADSAVWPRTRTAGLAGDMEEITKRMKVAERPIILAGGGAMASGAFTELQRFADEFGVPVATTINGKGVIDEHNPRAFGVVGLFGDVQGSTALQQADLVLALGTKFTLFNTFSWRIPGPDQTIIHIDADGEELGRTQPAAMGVVADVREACRQLLAELEKTNLSFDWKPVGDLPPQPGTRPDDPTVAPEAVVSCLNEIFDEDTILISDASLASGWCASRFKIRKPGRRMLAPRGIGGLGWACGGAIGAALAAPRGTRVVAVAGDGAAAYWLGEMETAARLNLPITFIILNNGSLGWAVQIEQQMGFNEVSRFNATNFAALGDVFGIEQARAASLQEAENALRKASGIDGPFILDVLSSEEACATVTYEMLAPETGPGGGAYGVS